MTSTNIRHIYWFAYFGLQEPSVRYRAKYPLELLRDKYKITYDLVMPSYRPLKIIAFLKVYFEILLSRKNDSIVVFEKIRTRRLYATALKILLFIRSKNTVYDIDDADYIKFPPVTIFHFMRHCEKCTVGSSALANVTRPLNKNVFLLTSPVIDHSYIKSSRNKRFTIGWIGYYTAHRDSLMTLFFPALLKAGIPVDLVIMGIKLPEHIREVNNYFSACENISVITPENINWQNEDEIYKQISVFDIGVAPLLNTPINQAKSAFKLKQYLSCGVPVLASSIGENKSFLEDGYNGYYCDDADDYYKRIMQVANMDDACYFSLSANALKTREKFNMQYYCDSLLEYLQCEYTSLEAQREQEAFEIY